MTLTSHRDHVTTRKLQTTEEGQRYGVESSLTFAYITGQKVIFCQYKKLYLLRFKGYVRLLQNTSFFNILPACKAFFYFDAAGLWLDQTGVAL